MHNTVHQDFVGSLHYLCDMRDYECMIDVFGVEKKITLRYDIKTSEWKILY